MKTLFMCLAFMTTNGGHRLSTFIVINIFNKKQDTKYLGDIYLVPDICVFKLHNCATVRTPINFLCIQCRYIKCELMAIIISKKYILSYLKYILFSCQ